MFLVIFALFLLTNCCGPRIYDTVESLPRGAYVIDEASFSKVPAPVRPYVVHFLRSKGCVIEKINAECRTFRYHLYADYYVEKMNGEDVAVLKLFADSARNRAGNALITIKRSINPEEPLERHIRLMVTALDNKYPILGGKGVAESHFAYGREVSLLKRKA